LKGGISYASLTRRDSQSFDYWESFGTGLIVAALLITVGGVITVYINLFTRQKPDEGEELE
jgi:hypothetical protein